MTAPTDNAERIWQKYDVIPLGEDGECYIIAGHDHDAGWKLALYILSESRGTAEGVDMLDSPVRVWLQEDYCEPPDNPDDWYEEGPRYTLCEPDAEGAKPYTAVTYGWKGWVDHDE